MKRFENISAVHLKKEKHGFTIDRSTGLTCYTFLHFISPVAVTIDGAEYFTDENAVIIYPPQMPQFFTATESYLEHNFIHFDLLQKTYLDSLPIGQIFYCSDSDMITHAVELINYTSITNGGNNASAETEKMLNELFMNLKSKKITTHNMRYSKKYKFLLTENKKEMERNPQNYSVQKMAKEAALSRNRFTSLYKIFFGISPKEDILAARISLAKKLLRNESQSIGDIAYLCGYGDASSFNRIFKNRTGFTPSEYRKQL